MLPPDILTSVPDTRAVVRARIRDRDARADAPQRQHSSPLKYRLTRRASLAQVYVVNV